MKSPGPGVLLVNSIELLRKKWYQFSTVFLKMFSSWGSTSQLVFSSVRFTRSVVSDSLRSHESQHARPPCPPPTPGVHSDSRPSSQWCHPAISSSVIPFSCLPSFPASGSFQMSQLFVSGGQSIGVSASTSVLSMNIQDWFPLGLTGLNRLSFIVETFYITLKVINL